MTFYKPTLGLGGGLGAPVQESLFTLDPAGASAGAFPSEVAVTLSVTATASDVPEHEPGGGRPKARHRGRVFIGPVSNLSGGIVGATSEAVVSQPMMDTLCAAGVALITGPQNAGVFWAVCSRKDAVLRQISGGWCDDAYDTIRSRGQKATVRTNWGTPQGLTSGTTLPANAITSRG